MLLKCLFKAARASKGSIKLSVSLLSFCCRANSCVASVSDDVSTLFERASDSGDGLVNSLGDDDLFGSGLLLDGGSLLLNRGNLGLVGDFLDGLIGGGIVASDISNLLLDVLLGVFLGDASVGRDICDGGNDDELNDEDANKAEQEDGEEGLLHESPGFGTAGVTVFAGLNVHGHVCRIVHLSLDLLFCNYNSRDLLLN